MNITRTTHDVQQGTGAWLRLREGFDTASEAPAALGVGKYVTRSELLRQKHTGLAAEHSPATLGKFEAGHAAEAKARPLAEQAVGGELFPVTMSAEVEDLRLLASMDGLDLDGDIAWETKLWNEELAADVRAGTLAEHYKVQMDQELLVSGASRCLFTCTDGTPERFVSCWYEASEERFAALLAGWRQFQADLATYTLPPVAEAAPVGKAPESLPALRIEVQGAVTASNLAEFKQTALEAIRSVNRNLSTDQDFADAEKAVKWCADVESRIAAAKEHALSQTASIDALFKALDDITAEAKRTRLDLDKLVTRRKTEVREEAITRARAALDAHIAVVNAEIAPMRLQPVAADFAGAIKGKRSVASMQDALDTTLAAAKIAADNQGRAIRVNLTEFKRTAEECYGFLFADLHQLVHKAADDFKAVVDARVAAHVAEQQRKAREKAEAEARAAAEAQRQAAAALAAAAAPVPAAVQVQACRPEDRAVLATPAGAEMVAKAAAALEADEPATLNLGDIGERLGFALRADFITGTLHVTPAAVERGLPRFRESQFQTICAQLLAHVSAMAELYAGETT